MKHKIFLTAFFLLIMTIHGIGQDMPDGVRIVNVGNTTQALRPGQIQVLNRCDGTVIIDCSVNGRDWGNTSVTRDGGVVVSIRAMDQYLRVRIIRPNGSDIIYKLRPKRRYIIEYSDELERVIIRNT